MLCTRLLNAVFSALLGSPSPLRPPGAALHICISRLALELHTDRGTPHPVVGSSSVFHTELIPFPSALLMSPLPPSVPLSHSHRLKWRSHLQKLFDSPGGTGLPPSLPTMPRELVGKEEGVEGEQVCVI